MNDNDQTTHFGFNTVTIADKAHKVAGVFHKVAAYYDMMNDAMSLGIHRLWKRYAANQAGVCPGQQILDVASGTGDLAMLLAKKVGATGKVIVSDSNSTMLEKARYRLTNAGFVGNIDYIKADAQTLPFPCEFVDGITMAFGLRNVADQKAALASMYRVLKPGGRLTILEFSHPSPGCFKALYDNYSFHIIPKLGKWFAGDEASYRYLVESIRMHPNQATLKTMMQQAGFKDVNYTNLTQGITALHSGMKSD